MVDLEAIHDLGELYTHMEKNYTLFSLAQKSEDLVPGEGSELASIFLIGEAPGYHESVQRRPFVGRSGQLLRSTLSEIGLQPTQIFISNIVKVRPPDNRDPSPQEIAEFREYVDAELRIVDPDLVVMLGRFSMAKFLPDAKISQVHGRLHSVKWRQKPLYVLPMYHPAAALRSTALKESFKTDFSKVTKIVEWISEQKKVQEYQQIIQSELF